MARGRIFALALGALALLGAGAVRPEGAAPALEERLQAVLGRQVERHGIRGVSAAIVLADGRLWTGTSGVSHETVVMDPDMLFGIGSVTKSFVAALTLRLVEEGALSLEDTVSEHLPPFPHVDGAITIRQLLDHTSGLYMFWDNDELWAALKADRDRIWAPEEVLAYIREPYFAPGEGWRYSNTNYLLVGMIVERATGAELSAMLRDRLLEPLGIEGYLSVQEEIPDRMAHVFGDDFQFGAAEVDLTYAPRASHESIIFGSGGLFMTAAGLARWSHALFGGEVLSPESMAEMLRFVSFRPVANMRAYGLGVQKFGRPLASCEEAIGHGGGNIGSATYMVFLPEHRTSVVVMVNSYPTRSADDITRGLIRAVLRDTGKLRRLPCIPFFPAGFLICCILAALAGMTISVARRWRRGPPPPAAGTARDD